MKLRRVHSIFNNPTLKKIKITNFHVGLQVLATLLVDTVILILWTVIDRPNAFPFEDVYAGTHAHVIDVECNTGLENKFELIMLAYKCILIAYAIRLVSYLIF
jgi:hypothetical protein